MTIQTLCDRIEQRLPGKSATRQQIMEAIASECMRCTMSDLITLLSQAVLAEWLEDVLNKPPSEE